MDRSHRLVAAGALLRLHGWDSRGAPAGALPWVGPAGCSCGGTPVGGTHGAHLWERSQGWDPWEGSRGCHLQECSHRLPPSGATLSRFNKNIFFTCLQLHPTHLTKGFHSRNSKLRYKAIYMGTSSYYLLKLPRS